ncbi:MAG: hypothetical protein HGB20_09480, partial [Chlorobiaceae bacterium]|nr:hypothetical protein [Chlorobiaceae bacterium]
MSTNHSTPLATVSEVSGKVWVRSQDGSYHLLHKGDAVYEGDIILTDDGSHVKLKGLNGAGIDIMSGKELVVSNDLFLDGSAAGEEDSSSSSPQAVDRTQSNSPANRQTDEGNLDTHGYMRVGRVNESLNSPYTFVSYTGQYSASDEGRTTNQDYYLDGRATTNERLQMSISPLSFTSVEFIPTTTYIPGTSTYYVPAVIDTLPTIIIPDDNGAEVSGEETVYEAGLANGSNPGSSDVVSGTFTVTAPDGLASIT